MNMRLEKNALIITIEKDIRFAPARGWRKFFAKEVAEVRYSITKMKVLSLREYGSAGLPNLVGGEYFAEIEAHNALVKEYHVYTPIGRSLGDIKAHFEKEHLPGHPVKWVEVERPPIIQKLLDNR